jgi:hypothetical protein
MPLPNRLSTAFSTELQKLSFDPMAVAGAMAGGKIMMSNLLTRHGMHIPAVRRVGQEIAGVGFRTAQQGKPMLSRPFREAASLIEPHAVGLYEHAHQFGSAAASAPATAKNWASRLQQGADRRGAGMAQKFLSGVPTESKGWRKALDYGFTPVSQVGRDVSSKIHQTIQRALPASKVPTLGGAQ